MRLPINLLESVRHFKATARVYSLLIGVAEASAGRPERALAVWVTRRESNRPGHPEKRLPCSGGSLAWTRPAENCVCPPVRANQNNGVIARSRKATKQSPEFTLPSRQGDPQGLRRE